MEDYRKKVTLSDGTHATLRTVNKNDKAGLMKFFAGVPEEDRLFLRDNVTKEEVVDRWMRDLDYDRVLPIIAEVEGDIVADATLHMSLQGWTRHVGEIRIVVARAYQKKGLGTILARELFQYAVQKGLQKIEASVMDGQVGALKAFRALGFQEEAVLKNHLMDMNDKKHDLIVLTSDVAELWNRIEDLIRQHDLKVELY
jgi:RimJ/RimL family protein N-acetyltransferase